MQQIVVVFIFFKQKTAYAMRIIDWSSDVCSSDLPGQQARAGGRAGRGSLAPAVRALHRGLGHHRGRGPERGDRVAAAPTRARGPGEGRRRGDRKSVVEGKSVAVRGGLGGRRFINNTKKQN